MAGNLEGKVAFITGAARGQGRAHAVRLATEGADIIAADICAPVSSSITYAAATAEDLAETVRAVEATGRKALCVETDVSDPEACTHLVALAMEELGHVDVLVNNAGIGTAVPATRETPEQFRQVIDVNLNGCYWMAQACGRVMTPGSSIVNISSVLGLTTAGLPQAAYVASKAGLLGLTRDLAAQWTGRKGIRVNAIAPGFFATEMTDQFHEGYLESQAHRIPAGRTGDPAELAAAVVFLASDAAAYVTGQTLAVDGGLTIA